MNGALLPWGEFRSGLTASQSNRFIPQKQLLISIFKFFYKLLSLEIFLIFLNNKQNPILNLTFFEIFSKLNEKFLCTIEIVNSR